MPSHDKARSQTATCNIFVHEGLVAALHRVKAGISVDEPKTGGKIDEFMEPHEHWARYMDRVRDLAEHKALRPNTLGVARELRDRLLLSLDMYHRGRGEELRRALRGKAWESILPSIEDK
ncbi:hypothetical protein EKO27_g2255 [Xylaria grammica]|uniref:Uncharacterized protein n=1 Tax=Xylaria grammica TaxID=363999 RepID=A0A439DEN6_9PEZI|nr:hypothetical protein EKO27_g2255 [Xylaria grammica]